MLYQEHKPPIALAHLINCAWRFDVQGSHQQPTVHTVLPDGCLSLAWHFHPTTGIRGPVITGPSTRSMVFHVRGGDTYLGLRINPAYHAHFTGQDPALGRDGVVPLQQQAMIKLCVDLGITTDNWITKLWQLTHERVAQMTAMPDVRIQQAIQWIVTHPTQTRLRHLMGHTGTSARQLQRSFKQHTGLSLREFTQVRRLRAAIIELYYCHKAKQDLVYDWGYYDQSHFLRAFRQLANMPLQDFFDYIDTIDHEGLL